VIYRTSRLEEVRNNIIEITIKVVTLTAILCIIKMEESTPRLLLEICFVFLLIHTVYWILVITAPTTYEISEKGIIWRNKWWNGFASWDRIHIKFKGDKAIICVRFAFLIVKKIILPKKIIKCHIIYKSKITC